ncbi:MAG: SIS domain-containing protein [Acidobacteriota bacterium]
MNIKKELLEIPHVLQQMLEEGRPQYNALIRRVSWTEKPVFMLGDRSSYLAALSGASTFESLLGVPVIVRRPAAFSVYTTPAIAARSLVIAVSNSGDSEELLQAVKKAKHRRATVWAVTADPSSELAGMADAVADYFPGESPADGALSVFCRHAVMTFLAVAAAQVIKGPARNLARLEEELEKLPEHVEWVLNRISDAGRALATELRSLSKVFVVGGGAFHPVAIQAADQLGRLAGVDASGWELLYFQQAFHHRPQPGEGILYLSSSHCGLKAQVHQSVREFRQKGGQKIFAITDSNDRQLSERATLAVLLPVLTEPAAALLALAFLDLVTHYTTQTSARSSAASH